MTTQFRFNLLKNIIPYQVTILSIEKIGDYYIFECFDRIKENIKNLSIHKMFIENKDNIHSVNAVIYSLVYNIRR